MPPPPCGGTLQPWDVWGGPGDEGEKSVDRCDLCHAAAPHFLRRPAHSTECAQNRKNTAQKGRRKKRASQGVASPSRAGAIRRRGEAATWRSDQGYGKAKAAKTAKAAKAAKAAKPKTTRRKK